MNLNDWLSHCERLHPQTIEMGLDRVAVVANTMGLKFDCPVVTVAGTNGKGSTCAMLESVYRQSGYKNGFVYIAAFGVFSRAMLHQRSTCGRG